MTVVNVEINVNLGYIIMYIYYISIIPHFGYVIPLIGYGIDILSHVKVLR